MRKLIILLASLGMLIGLAAPAFASDRPEQVRHGFEQSNPFWFFGHPFFHRASLRDLTETNDCTLKVPRHPLTAQGLATPYVLGNGNDGTVCTEENQATAAFVQAVIYSPSTGQLSTYNPPVRDAGQPLLGTPPPVPQLPSDAVVAIWTGFNDNVLKLTGHGARQFTNFAQQAYDNSPQWFNVVNNAVRNHQITVPPLGTGKDGMTCPSVRDWSVVDQDQSDNVPVTYSAYGTTNGSDDQLINNIDQALGCTQWTVPSLSQPGATSTAGPLDEIQAQMYQPSPQALVPGGDEFVTNNGGFLPPLGTSSPDLFFDNLYRQNVGQPQTWNDNDTKAYCENLNSIGAPRLKADATIESAYPPPVFAEIASTLSGVLQARFEATWANLNCTSLTGLPDPY